jgi:UDP-3-O-[3-hydroxymyristoyl] glucosamine N-acyltransferase
MKMKYELTDETLEFEGHVLHRVKYLKSNTLGGWIESERNLSQREDAIVWGNARVYGHALVDGDAVVIDSAKVYGHARITNNAIISDYAEIYDSANILGNSNVSGNAKVYETATVRQNARIFGDAEVFGDSSILEWAEVSGHAKVYESGCISGRARVYDNAIVHNNASVQDHAKIANNAELYGNVSIMGYTYICGGKWNITPLQIAGSNYFFNVSDERKISVGCHTMTVEEWRDIYIKKFKDYDFTIEEQIEYIRYFNLASDMYDYGFKLPFPEELNNQL